MKFVRWLSAFLICLSSFTAGAEDNPQTATQFDSLRFRDCFGKDHALRDLGDIKVVVIAFLGTECPLAKLYGPRLQELAKSFEHDGVVFLGACSNVQDSLTEITDYTNKAGIEFPMLVDNEQQLADLLRAERTPEVMVLDHNRTIRYRGRIDDQYGIGIVRQQPEREDLADAVRSLLKGEAPAATSSPAVGCVIGRRRHIKPHGEITFSKHIAPILNARCVECHRSGEIAPFSLTSFADTVGWEATMAEVIREGRMPPWNADPEIGHFKNDARLSNDEKNLILTWIANGCPEGNSADLPPAREFATGWRMPEPDRIIPIRDEPFTVAASGVVDYQYFKVDPNFTEDMYVTAAEARPGNPSVVHHIIAFLQLPGSDDFGLGRMLIGYAPGTSPLIYPDGAAMHVPAGSKILFEVHYTPNGYEQTDLSYIGLKFADAASVKNEVVGVEALNHKLKIPPGAANHIVTSERKLREDLSLLSLTPHMHLRGKSFRYDATYPDGTTETLLNVPKYDFNWQLRYEFAEPKLIPKGTVIRCTAGYDNSEDNPNNPDASKEIGWGQQSWDEMMIGFITGIRKI